jgi:carbon monoxide dehydrogenase subunit G
MRLENTFDVPAAPDRAWAVLMDVPTVIPCMPGAELTETVDDSTWKATISVKMGPMSLVFASDVRRIAADEATRTATLEITAREVRGRGSGHATVTSSLAPAAGGTRVTTVTELTTAGTVAQFGRGLVEPVSARMIAGFADRLRASMMSDQPPAPEPARPVSGLRLGLAALVHWLRGLGGRRPASTNHPEGGSG